MKCRLRASSPVRGLSRAGMGRRPHRCPAPVLLSPETERQEGRAFIFHSQYGMEQHFYKQNDPMLGCCGGFELPSTSLSPYSLVLYVIRH